MENKKFKELNLSLVGRTFTSIAQLKMVKQTSGPTLMIMNDSENNFTFKAFEKAGVRAYPHILEEDYVRINFKVSKRFEKIEGEVLSITKLGDDEVVEFKKEAKRIEDKMYLPATETFSIESEKFDKMKPDFFKMTKIIKQAVFENRPIILRHNADCDGYSSAITIERAIKKFYEQIGNGDLSMFYLKYKRQPSKAPFYEYDDCFKDLTYWLRDHKRNGEKAPLIIITDNGSTEEDLISIKQMKIYDSKIVVLDHHPPTWKENGESLISDYVDCHINPYLYGFDSNLCAGILGFELARFVYKENTNMFFIPAMSSIIDHTKSMEQDKYIELAKAEGYTKESLTELGEIIDMYIFYLRFTESREFVDEIFGADLEKQKAMVELFSKELDKKYESVEKIAKHYSEKFEFDKFDLFLFNGEYGTNRGKYPQIGKATNHIHRTFENENDKPVITATYGSTFMTLRCSDGIENFSVIDFCDLLTKKYDYTGAEGGGHKKAGSVKFVEYAKQEIIQVFKDYLKTL